MLMTACFVESFLKIYIKPEYIVLFEKKSEFVFNKLRVQIRFRVRGELK